MNKEIKVRLICLIIGICLIGTGFFLSGSWRDEDLGNGTFIQGKPIFEKDLITESCGYNCTFVKMDTSLLLRLVGVMIGMCFIVPIKLTNDVIREVTEVKE